MGDWGTREWAGTSIGAVGTIGSVGAGIWANKKANETKANIETMQATLTQLENDRPPIQDVYAAITDTSGELRNEYRNKSYKVYSYYDSKYIIQEMFDKIVEFYNG